MVVNDGSTDATTAALGVAQHIYPQLRVITLPKNVGKRRAMAEGIREATGAAFVMIDSDTLIVPGALNRIATALNDPSVGAVSGTTIILNEQVNALTRAQSLIYEISFRVHKSAEARFGAVSCCPGCFSVYRREAVLPLLERWRDETFLGRHSIFGDDRALTMLLLRDGWKNTFQPDAIARTAVPERVRGYLRQQLRWKKSWLQQGLRASLFMWRQHQVAAAWFYLGLFLSLIGPVFAFRAMVVDPLVLGTVPWRYVVGAACVSIALASYLSVRRRDARRLTAVLILPLIAIVLAFQMPFAIARLSDARWGTR